MPKIGAHVSAAISLDLSIDRAQEIGSQVTQFFISPPQQWLQTPHGEEEITAYLKKVAESGIEPNFIHGTYLVNLGTDNPEHLKKSIAWLIYAMEMAHRLKSGGVIFHLGSHKGRGFEAVLPQIVEAITVILNVVKDIDSYLILENSAGAGGVIGSSFHELGEILRLVQNDRLKICLDTQHSFAAGYDIKSLVGLKDVLEEFEQEIGLANLVAIHANDSKTEYKSNRDRHENIGDGFIGKEAFENLVNHPLLKDVPFILEVPGFAGNGPDKENLDLLKSFIS